VITLRRGQLEGPLVGPFVVLLAILLLACASAGAETPRPPAAAIASAHPLATQAGQEVLQAGGNAFDAAVAVAAVLAVVEPYSSGLGGGGFWLLHRATDGRDVMLDGRERAPLAASRDMYLGPGGQVVPDASVDGPLAAAIPGSPAAMVYLAREYGRLPLGRSLAAAIRLAREGFPVDATYRAMARFRLATLQARPAAAAVFLAAGDVPAAGSLLRQPELAATLEALVQQGHEGFYGGHVATALVQGVRQAGGIWSVEDLASYRVIEREPVRFDYRGLRITSAAPPSSGGVALGTMLGILAGYDLGSLDRVGRDHLLIEAMRRAYRDRAEFLGDPDFVSVPVARLIHPWYAAGLRASIRSDRATASAALPGIAGVSEGNHTTHFSILDRDGNRVAATLTINYPFGSCFVVAGTGVLLNDEMDDFSAKPGVPNVYGLVGAEANAIAPGKRPLSSMSPTFIEGERGVGIIGTPGGSRIITMVLHAVLGFAAGEQPKEWVSRPRFHHQYLPDEVQYEAGAFTDAESLRLQALGHRLRLVEGGFGNMQAVLWERRANRVLAASDPRGIGAAEVH
jgi:gamma-glutamyltranspeptidase/glutathione hydrolase